MPLDNLKKYRVKLASGSPRRRELLGMIDVEFEIPEMVEVEESVPEGTAAEKVPLYLANLKADAYAGCVAPDDLYITADTVVVVGDEIIGKPKDSADAKAMIAKLAGKKHRVITGVCILTSHRREAFTVETDVEMAPLSREEIDYYVDRYAPLDKAGAYGIQEWIGGAAVKAIDGSFYNVMGLPLHALYKALQTF